jgi:hypothetical protein
LRSHDDWAIFAYTGILNLNAMKKFSLILCLLFAVSVRMIYSQTAQLASGVTLNDNISDYSLLMEPILPDVVMSDQSIASPRAEKLTMVACPNPFTNRTIINCFLPVKGKLTLEIRNMFGSTVKTTELNIDQDGTHSIEITSEHLRPGIYTAMLILKTSDDMLMKTIRIVYNQ